MQVIETKCGGRLVRGVMNDRQANWFMVKLDDKVVHKSSSSFHAVLCMRELEEALETESINRKAEEEEYRERHEKGIC